MKFIKMLIVLSIAFQLPAAAENKKQKIVSIGGSVTEIIYALGSFNDVVASDLSSIYPAQAQKLKSVGYWRNIAAEGVLSIDADVIIASEQSGPDSSINQIKSSGKKLALIDDKPTIDSAKKKITQIANILHKENFGKKLITDLDKDLAKLKDIQKKIKSNPKVLFIYARGSKNLLVAGKNTAPDSMIKLAKGTNAISEFEGFKPLTSEAVVSSDPDVILMLSHGIESLGGTNSILTLPGISLTNAGKNKRIVAMDDLYLLGFTNRVGKALTDLTYSLHKELKK